MKFLCIFAALFAVCSASGLYNPYGSVVGGIQYSRHPQAKLLVAPSLGYGLGGLGGYGGLGLGGGHIGLRRGYGVPVLGRGLVSPGISNIGLAKTALNLPSPGIGPIRRAPAVISTLSEPLVAHGLQYGGVPSVARSANAAAASSSVRSAAPIAIPAITVPRTIYGGRLGGIGY